MISHIIPMSDVQRALEISASQKSAKVILKPWE
jgi:threonine dehydrogenase-like Zn-dependent dehydrogenase